MAETVGRELWVGVGEQYATLASAVAASRDGDTVYVRAGVYENDFATVDSDIRIVGVEGMAHFTATGTIPNGKAILITRANVVIENLEFSGAHVPDWNGSGIRHEAGNLTVRNSYFHDNEMGILTGEVPGGEIRIEGSKFVDTRFADGVQGDGITHALYVGYVDRLIVSDSEFYNTEVGHHIKSRAKETSILNSILDDGVGTASYNIDLPNGGVAVITGNTIIQSAISENPTMINYASHPNLHEAGSMLIEGNTFIDHHGSGTGVWNRIDIVATIKDNSFLGLETIVKGPAQSE